MKLGDIVTLKHGELFQPSFGNFLKHLLNVRRFDGRKRENEGRVWVRFPSF